MTIFKDYTKCHDRKFTSMISTDLVDVYKRESYMHAINRCSCRRTESKAQVCETSLLDCCCITITFFSSPALDGHHAAPCRLVCSLSKLIGLPWGWTSISCRVQKG